MEIYVVDRGDNVDQIAASTGISVWQLIYDNQLIYPYELAVGQALVIDNGIRNASRAVSVSGYAYPFISEWVLAETLPFLSELPIFSYGFTMEGELIPPLWDDEWMIREALRYGTQPILVLTPFGPDGNFNNQLIHSVVNNWVYAENLISNLLRVMEEKGYQGVDIDFEYILAQDRDAFTGFVWWVADTMRENGYHTSVALAPKTSSEQRGLLYEGKDYRALGEAADHVLLMTYEWGYTYGPPMAVAPLNQVRRVVEYAVTQIDPAKIDLGIPNYGYDWPLPFERGVTMARTLGNVEAVRIAIEKGSAIAFDPLAQSPYFFYTENGITHEVWFEDPRSLMGKFRLMEEYGLRGCGYWQIMQWFRANWLLLRSQFYILK
ncbi:MAG TPA: LysM peptidoglycan-binding domain-containing protein [Candidatus Acetatifactor stercoripullorum]|uniref:LysM peptidoglycan-binding domain-containing protein n=1 Tax=Candidatus Acetatifactor stercoripullorum TaxID=2838414 RepID=A0A9D1R5A8_9FIRM|nr:glycosyl hydrolase family 18 protein [uncultured Acetatifactor sp.]HIW81544.1 LysM peptidoglycan-binding domain-containing protein [Candidatus Acetatifactor stercoripullorum]